MALTSSPTPPPPCLICRFFVELQGDAVRNLTWPAWEVSKKALVFPTAPVKPLPLQDEEFSKRMQDFLNTRQVRPSIYIVFYPEALLS